MRPSAITHSILVRLYQRAGYEDDAAEAVAQLYQHHGIERPMGGERCKTLGKKVWGVKSPTNHCRMPPCGSPPHGFSMPRDRAESNWSGNSWETAPLPGHESEQSGCSTPMSGAVFLPFEAMRQCQMQHAMHGPLPGSFMGSTPHSNDQFGFPVPFLASSPTQSCDVNNFNSPGQPAYPQWQYGCTMPAPFACAPAPQAGAPEVAYPCHGMVQPFAVMPVPMAPPFSVACAPVPQPNATYEGWGPECSMHVAQVSLPCCT